MPANPVSTIAAASLWPSASPRSLGPISLFAFVLLTAALTTADASRAAEDSLSLAELKGAIIEALADARKFAAQPPHFLVKAIKLNLRGSSARGGEVGFSLKIFGVGVDLGAGVEAGQETTLSLELVPAKEIVTGGAPKIDFARLIQELKAAFTREKSQAPAFLVKSVTYEVAWALKRNAHGGVDFKIADAEVKISDARRQTISLTLCETLNLRDCAVKSSD